jgi:hypothetical protein
MTWDREQTTPTERPKFVGEVAPTFADRGCQVNVLNTEHKTIDIFLEKETI